MMSLSMFIVGRGFGPLSPSLKLNARGGKIKSNFKSKYPTIMIKKGKEKRKVSNNWIFLFDSIIALICGGCQLFMAMGHGATFWFHALHVHFWLVEPLQCKSPIPNYFLVFISWVTILYVGRARLHVMYYYWNIHLWVVWVFFLLTVNSVVSWVVKSSTNAHALDLSN